MEHNRDAWGEIDVYHMRQAAWSEFCRDCGLMNARVTLRHLYHIWLQVSLQPVRRRP